MSSSLAHEFIISSEKIYNKKIQYILWYWAYHKSFDANFCIHILGPFYHFFVLGVLSTRLGIKSQREDNGLLGLYC